MNPYPERPGGRAPSATDTLWDVRTHLWRLSKLRPAALRLLTPEQNTALEGICEVVHTSAVRLLQEIKPDLMSGQRVAVRRTVVCGSWAPAPTIGTRGTVAWVEWDPVSGWWVVVRFDRPFQDTAGRTWNTDDTGDPQIKFKANELRRVGRRMTGDAS